MQSDEKITTTTIHADNMRDLLSAQQMFSQRADCEWSCFETLTALNNAALTILIVDEIDEMAVSGLNELLLLQSALIKAAYAHYRLRDKPVTTKPV